MTFLQRVNSLPWFHELDLGNGIRTPGKKPLESLQAEAAIYFQDSLSEKTVLDIGCWDGFNSFEAKKRGAKRVLATDHFAWSKQCWGSRESFDLAKKTLGSDVEVMDIDLYDISESTVGKFDVVLFLGVFYHLRNPFLGLEKAASVCNERLIVETHLDNPAFNRRPAMVFYPGKELGGDGSNWWGPNKSCITAMLNDLGFTSTFFKHPTAKSRGIFISRRTHER